MYSLLSVALLLVSCTTVYDADLLRYLTRCSDGSRFITRYDGDFQRYRHKILPPAPAPPRPRVTPR